MRTSPLECSDGRPYHWASFHHGPATVQCQGSGWFCSEGSQAGVSSRAWNTSCRRRCLRKWLGSSVMATLIHASPRQKMLVPLAWGWNTNGTCWAFPLRSSLMPFPKSNGKVNSGAASSRKWQLHCPAHLLPAVLPPGSPNLGCVLMPSAPKTQLRPVQRR